MPELYWPTVFSPADCIEDAWDERRCMRIRRFGGPVSGTVIETRIELGIWDQLRRSDRITDDRTNWFEYTPLLCARCDRPDSYHHDPYEDRLGHCPCPRCGENRYITTAYEVNLDINPMRNRKLHQRLAHVKDQTYDSQAGARLYWFEMPHESGLLWEKALRLEPGSSVPCSKDDLDYDTTRCVSCRTVRSSVRPIGAREHCPTCGNAAWEVMEYRSEIYPEIQETPATSPAEIESKESGSGLGCFFATALALLALILYLRR